MRTSIAALNLDTIYFFLIFSWNCYNCKSIATKYSSPIWNTWIIWTVKTWYYKWVKLSICSPLHRHHSDESKGKKFLRYHSYWEINPISSFRWYPWQQAVLDEIYRQGFQTDFHLGSPLSSVCTSVNMTPYQDTSE